MPRVSISLPVYNRKDYVKDAIESVLAQTYQDWELIITDNASTDGTDLVCQAYAERDSRIRYYRQPENLGAARNFNHGFELATGDYFKWLASDDGIEPRFLEETVRALDQQPDVILACSWYTNFNEFTGEKLSIEADHNLLDSTPRLRLLRLLSRYPGPLLPFHGLIRRDILEKTHLVQPFTGADICFLVEMALLGKFFQIPDHLIWLRDHPDAFHTYKYQTAYKESDVEARWFDSRNKNRLHMPYWRRFLEFQRLILICHDRWFEKFRMLLAVSVYFPRTWGGYLWGEILKALGLARIYRHFKTSCRVVLRQP